MTTGRPPTRRRSWRDGLLRPAVGLLSIFAMIVIVALALALFQGGFTSSVPVTVISQRAGLVMYPDARVKLRGVEVGRVSSIEERTDGTAAIHLAMDPKQLDSIPDNARVAVVASTAFGAKFVQLVEPPMPSQERMRAGQVIEAEHVTVEVNNVFDRLSTVLSTVEPGKLNATLGALSSAMSGRGRQMKQTIASLDSFLARLEPSLPTAHVTRLAGPSDVAGDPPGAVIDACAGRGEAPGTGDGGLVTLAAKFGMAPAVRAAGLRFGCRICVARSMRYIPAVRRRADRPRSC